MKPKNLSMWFYTALCLLGPLPLLGQFSTVSCTHGETGTCRQATTCSQANVQAAINASASGGAGYVSPTSFIGDGVYIPAGSCTWSSSIGWSNKNINLIANSPTIQHPSSDAIDYTITNSGATAAASRISGFNFTGSMGGHWLLLTGSGQGSGSVPTTGTAWAGFFRVDHITYNYSNGANGVQIYGSVFGVFDHLNGTEFGNHFEQSNLLDAEYNAMHSSNYVQFEGEYAGRILSAAPGSSSPGGLGSKYMDYIEDSTFSCPGNYSGAISDSESGGQRMVFRHNTLSGTCFWYAHWTRGDEWDGDLYEIYDNVNTGNANGQNPFRMEAGTGVIFNNTFPGTWSDLTVHLDDRRAGGGEASAHAYACDGSSSPAGRPIIDGNAGDAIAPGWPCAGQIGNACLNGGCVRGSGSGGMGSLPLLLWNNGSLGVAVDPANANYIKTTAHSATNLNGAKDYCLAATTMPSSCGIYTNTYTPYTYPYPTTTGGGTTFTLGITAANGSVSGSNCSAGTYASGTSVGACTANPNTGYSFAGWSSTGSASCSGTGTCGPFSLAANSTLTASFTLNSWTLTTATAGSGSGTITGCSGAHNYGSTYTCTVTPSAGSTITSVTGCGGSGTSTFTGTMPNNACTVTATFSNTLATPTFTPPAGTYSSAQWVTINSPSGTQVFKATEGSNGNSSNGDAPSRNLYTNCAEGWNGSALTPTGVPVGDLYCNVTDKTNAVAAGGPNLGVVTAANSGTGIHPVENGMDAGGDDSAASLTATYGQANQNGCPVGTNIVTSFPGITLPGNVSAANTTYGITTQSGNFNTSLLAPTKWTYSGGDSALYWVRETCQKVNTTSVAGEHLEYDTNYNTTAGVYIGQGWDFDFPNGKFRFDPQGGSWHNVKLVAADGTISTTYSWPANHWIYTQIWMHHDAVCNTGPASGCTFYYDRLCVGDYTAGTGLTCYNLQDATTGLTPQGTAVSKTTWTRNEFALQHQWDVNQASATLTNTVDFDNLVAFSLAPNVFYTTNGSTPTTGSTPYYLPVAVPSSLTIKALANQSGFTNSAVGSAAYVISPMNTLVLTNTNGAVSGANCATGSYATGTSVGACTATPNAGFSFTGWSGTGACSSASGTGTTSCTLSSNGTLTASFAPILTCGDPSQLSPNFSGTYTVPPTTLPMAVGFTSPTSGCTMHYTSDGSAPTCGSTAYPGGNLSITAAGTYQYRVIACQSGYVSSAAVGGTWQVNAASSVHVTLTGTQSFKGTGSIQ